MSVYVSVCEPLFFYYFRENVSSLYRKLFVIESTLLVVLSSDHWKASVTETTSHRTSATKSGEPLLFDDSRNAINANTSQLATLIS